MFEITFHFFAFTINSYRVLNIDNVSKNNYNRKNTYKITNKSDLGTGDLIKKFIDVSITNEPSSNESTIKKELSSVKVGLINILII